MVGKRYTTRTKLYLILYQTESLSYLLYTKYHIHMQDHPLRSKLLHLLIFDIQSLSLLLHPLTTNPSVEKLKREQALVKGHHVAGSMNSQEGEVATALDNTDLVSVTIHSQVSELGAVESFLARPLQSLGPGFVTEPVADEVGITLESVC